jgi:signal transduction histidine kinase
MWIFHSSDASKARSARREFVKKLRACAGDGDYTHAELVFSELLNNVVQHAPGFVNIWVDCSQTTAVLYVHDYGPGCTIDRTDNGGLALVRRLSSELGVNRVSFPGGTQVRVVLGIGAAPGAKAA